MSLSLSPDSQVAGNVKPIKRRIGGPTLGMVDDEPLEMRQLRHQTKNALQRILWELSRAGGEECSLAGVRRLAVLEKRVCLAAEIADALFGFTRSPGPIVDRLHALGTGMIELLSAEEQNIALDVVEHGPSPDRFHTLIVRVAHEMIGNALKHGLRNAMRGTITIRLFAENHQLRLVVADDGCGFEPGLRRGSGMGLMQEMAAEHGGNVVLRRVGHLTAAELTLPSVHVFARRSLHAV